MNRARRTIEWAPLCALAVMSASCTLQPPSAVLYVSDPEGAAEGAVALRIGRVEGEKEPVPLDGRSFPLSVTVTRESDGDYAVVIEAVDGDDVALAGAVREVTFTTGEVETTAVTLRRVCDPSAADADARCADGLFCSGVERCGADGFCVAGLDPCAAPHDCVVSRCDETLDLCDVGVDHERCEGEVSGDGTPICDLLAGCVLGTRCTLDAECDDGADCNGQETCVLGGCAPGEPPVVVDDNVCTVDVCTEAAGVQHIPLPNGSLCTRDDGTSGVCRDIQCSVSICGDGVVDDFLDEECDDGNANDLDLCASDCTRITRVIEPFFGGGYCGDQGLAGMAMLTIDDAAVTPEGGLLLSEDNRGLFRHWDKDTDVVSTVAGVRQYGFSVDGTPAHEALIMYSYAVASQPGTGRVFFSSEDAADRAFLRYVDDEGRIRTLAGGGAVSAKGYTGDARQTTLVHIRDLQFDPTGNLLYVLDGSSGYALHRIDVSDLDAPILTHIAGTDFETTGPRSLSFTGATDLAVLADGTVLVSFDSSAIPLLRDGIHRFDLADPSGFVRVAGDGTCTATTLDGGDVLVTPLCGVRHVEPGFGPYTMCFALSHDVGCVDALGVITHLAGDGAASDPVVTDGSTRSPMGQIDLLTATSDALYVAGYPDYTDYFVRLTVAAARSAAAVEIIKTEYGDEWTCGIGGDARMATLYDPGGVFDLSTGTTLATDKLYDVAPDFTITLKDGFDYAFMATEASDGTIFTLKYSTLRLYPPGSSEKTTLTSGGGDTTSEGIPVTQASFSATSMVATSPTRVVIAEEGRARLREVAYDDGQALWIVRTIAGTGVPVADDGDGPALTTPLHMPFSIGQSTSGDLIFAERQTGRVRKLEGGAVITLADFPVGITGFAVDISGNAWVADAEGRLWLLAGGDEGSPKAGAPPVWVAGDGTAALASGTLGEVPFQRPRRVDVGRDGTLYFNYDGSYQILRARVVDPALDAP